MEGKLACMIPWSARYPMACKTSTASIYLNIPPNFPYLNDPSGRRSHPLLLTRRGSGALAGNIDRAAMIVPGLRLFAFRRNRRCFLSSSHPLHRFQSSRETEPTVALEEDHCLALSKPVLGFPACFGAKSHGYTVG